MCVAPCNNSRASAAVLTPEQSLDTFSHDIDPRIVKFFRADRWLADDAFNAAHSVVPIRSISLCNATTCRTAVPAPGGGLDALGHRRMKYVNDTSACAAAQCRECFCDASKAYVEGACRRNSMTATGVACLCLRHALSISLSARTTQETP